MDKVLSSPEAVSCPFASFEESLLDFTRTVYGLQLNGSGEYGFYDPNNLYSQPYVSVLAYKGKEIIFGAKDQSYPSGIRSSFGMDFVDIVLDSELQGKPLVVEIITDMPEKAVFNIRIAKLFGPHIGLGLSAEPFIISPVLNVERDSSTGIYQSTIAAIDLESYNQLGLIIT